MEPRESIAYPGRWSVVEDGLILCDGIDHDEAVARAWTRYTGDREEQMREAIVRLLELDMAPRLVQAACRRVLGRLS